MAILLNGAGTSAADPILKNLPFAWIIAASTMDISTFTDAWIDQNNTFPGTNSIKASLSPAATVLTAGTAGSYNDTDKRYTISSTTGLSVGDKLYLSHADLTAGIYEIATIPISGAVTLTTNPLNGLGNKTGISYQVAWTYNATAGTAPMSSDGTGVLNYFKVRASDSGSNQTDATESTYVRDAPSGSSYISIDGKSYTGQTTNDATPSFALLSAWTNNGGVSHIAFTNHSVQTGSTDFKHGDGSTTEKTTAATESGGLSFTAGDGQKYGRILLKSKAGGTTIGVDLDMIVDTGGPVITMVLAGR
jgi:hypothetical protein